MTDLFVTIFCQVENNFRRLESPRSSIVYSADESPNSRTFFDSGSPKRCFRGNYNLEPCLDRTKYTYDVQSDSDRRDFEEMKKVCIFFFCYNGRILRKIEKRVQ